MSVVANTSGILPHAAHGGVRKGVKGGISVRSNFVILLVADLNDHMTDSSFSGLGGKKDRKGCDTDLVIFFLVEVDPLNDGLSSGAVLLGGVVKRVDGNLMDELLVLGNIRVLFTPDCPLKLDLNFLLAVDIRDKSLDRLTVRQTTKSLDVDYLLGVFLSALKLAAEGVDKLLVLLLTAVLRILFARTNIVLLLPYLPLTALEVGAAATNDLPKSNAGSSKDGTLLLESLVGA